MDNVKEEATNDAEGWREAAIAWSVCASIHEKWAKGKDAVYKMRHADFERHAENARQRYKASVVPNAGINRSREAASG